MAFTIYTLKNCDTCKRALKWLDAKGADYSNLDIRSDGLDMESITTMVRSLGWEAILNRRSTTWRGLREDQKYDLNDAKAAALISQHPTLMKRPAIIFDQEIIVGFDAKSQSAIEAHL